MSYLRGARAVLVPALALIALLLVVATNAGATAITGTATINAGSLAIFPPTALGWTANLNGLDQNVADTTTADQTFDVSDPTGSGSGWHVTAAATAFSCQTSGTCNSDTLGANAFSLNGSTSDHSLSSGPSVACATGATGCTVAVGSGVTYPVTIATSATTVFSAGSGTGLGRNTFSGVGWWLSIPSATKAGTYTSSVTLAVVTGP